jgi:hypothetical protein
MDRAYLLRPTAAFTDNPLCTLAELKTVLTLSDLADFHEALDLHDAAAERAEEQAERERQQQRGRRR